MPATYKIGEAAALLNLKTYILRFWETEFSQIVPLRTEKGQRLYTEEHLALLERIRFLLHERGLTIEGARRALREEAAKGARYPLPQALAARRAEEAGTPAPEPLAGKTAAHAAKAASPGQALLMPVEPAPPAGVLSPLPDAPAPPRADDLPTPDWDDRNFAVDINDTGSLVDDITAELHAIAAVLRGPDHGNLQ